MKNKKTLAITAAVLIITVLTGFAVIGKERTKAIPVKTSTAVAGELNSYLSTNAVIRSKNTKSYTGTAQLIIKSVNVKVGDPVKAGQAMVQYDLSDMETSVSQAKIQYNNAVLQRKELVNQRDQLKSTLASLDSQIKQLEGSKNPADAAQLQALKQKREAIQPISDEKIQQMDNSVSLAKLTLDSASSKYAKNKDGIVAEFDGIVTALNAAEGASINLAQPAVVVQQLENLQAVLSLGKYDAMKVKVGQEALLKSGGKTYKGIVSFISPAAEKTVSATGQTTTLEAEIDILDETPELKVDFDVNVDILLGGVKDVVKVPVECIKYDKDEKASVYTVVDGKAKQVAVVLGLQSGTEVQVTEGLSSGDIVILNPGIAVKDGIDVQYEAR